MLANDYWPDVAEMVHTDDFYTPKHRHIFDAIGRLISNLEAADVITVSELLNRNQLLQSVDGTAYLAQLTSIATGSGNVLSYARIVQETSYLRQLIHVAQSISEQCYEPGDHSIQEILDRAEQSVFNLTHTRKSAAAGTLIEIKPFVDDSLQKIHEVMKNQSALSGCSTGFGTLDKMTSGLQKSDLIIVAGRPSVGKTSLALSIGTNVAIHAKKTLAVFSMEMPGWQLVTRLLSTLSYVAADRIRRGQLNDKDWHNLNSSMNLLKQAPIFIDESADLSIMAIRTRCRRLAQKQELGMVLIDYLQLMQTGSETQHRANQLAQITRSLKILAKELDTPIVLLSQLNRNVEWRGTEARPRLSDLRDSGAIEQDADLVLMLHREQEEASSGPIPLELIIAKQRNGPRAIIPMNFEGKYYRFLERDQQHSNLDHP